MDNIKLDKFYKEMFSDQNFKNSFIKICEETQEKTSEERFDIILKELILPFAKDHNYNLTEEDIKAYEEAQIQNLSEEDLENISGGSISAVLSSVLLLLNMPIASITSFIIAPVSQAVKTGATVASYLKDAKATFGKKANVRYVKNAIGDTVGAHGIGEAAKKLYNYATGSVAAPETEKSLQDRTGLTAAADLDDLGIKIEEDGNVAILTSNEKSGGLGCSTETLLGYIKNKINAPESLRRIVLKGFPDVQLGGTSNIPIIWMDSNSNIKSVRIPSSNDKNFNFVYYPETEQMYVAGSGTPTITQKDLDLIKELAKLPVPIKQINMWGWKSFFPGFRQQLKFEKGMDWKNINDSFGNYQYFSQNASDQSMKYNNNLKKFNEIWFKDKLQEKNGVSIESDGTLTLNFKQQINSAIDLTNDIIDTLVTRCNFIQKGCPQFTKKIRLNFISQKNEVNISDHNITQITTSIIKNAYANSDEEKFTNTVTEKFIGKSKIIIDQDKNTTTAVIKGDINIQEIKAHKPNSLEFENFKAVKQNDGYVYIYPSDNQHPDKITISDDEINAIGDIFDVSDIYSKTELKCNWRNNNTWRYWGYSKK